MNVKTVTFQITMMILLPILVPLTFPLVIDELQVTSTELFSWFDNHIKANPGNSHLLLSFKTLQVVSTGGTTITSSTAETLLGILIDSELNFENYVLSICNKRRRNTIWVKVFKNRPSKICG